MDTPQSASISTSYVEIYPKVVTDSISAIKFGGPTYFAVSSWDGQVRIFTRNDKGFSVTNQYTHSAPVLSCCWQTNNLLGRSDTVFSGGCDNTVKSFTLFQNDKTSRIIGQHSAPVKCVNYISAISSVCTGSWDKTVALWDIRSPNNKSAVQKISVPERVYAMDCQFPSLVVGTADHSQVFIYDLRNTKHVYQTQALPFKYHIRSITCFPDYGSGYAVGSVDGKVAMASITETTHPIDFSFKCHSKSDPTGDTIYSVNWIGAYPRRNSGLFVTAGGDGLWNLWSKQAKSRMYQSPTVGPLTPITCGDFCCDFESGKDALILGYSYDWNKGANSWIQNKQDRQNQTRIMLATMNSLEGL
eukprot:TRINITY_DN4846_c0_g1_i1.p1 TRINITY_DN4846_c0_g1~~TRINITY_DN4846_c0_g1_i1.p1  ORF type:complete len:358 (-),score=53.30 TRINITY_DN4846_c0_g1_i1:25-1098(-)